MCVCVLCCTEKKGHGPERVALKNAKGENLGDKTKKICEHDFNSNGKTVLLYKDLGL